MATKKRTTQEKEVQDYRHDAKRKNNPPAGIAAQGKIHEKPKQEYTYNPHLPPNLRFDPKGDADKLPELLQIAQQRPLTAEETKTIADALRHHEPWLEWAGKQETKSFAVDPVALHIHERVSTKAILKVAERENVQRSLFADPQQEYNEAVDFYQHDVDWANRLILGDSLTVMSSLAHREDLAGKVQMIYIDPPYGIKFASNFQPTVFQRDVKDREQDLTREREQIKAYRDTWTLGVHSYLAYLRDRLIVAKDLLTDSGSIFVQISDENIHRVRSVMDEVFGGENFISLLVFTKTRSLVSSDFVTTICDYILWYAKDRDLAKEKMRKVFLKRQDNSLTTHFENTNGEILTAGEYNLKQQNGGNVEEFKPFKSDDLIRKPNPEIEFDWHGRKIEGRFRTNEQGLKRALQANRILFTQSGIRYKFFLDDFPVSPLNCLWDDVIGAQNPNYVVQTNTQVIQRCLLMTTDPGDLVLDPTCVRKGTMILRPPFIPPQAGGEGFSERHSSRAGGEGFSERPSSRAGGDEFSERRSSRAGGDEFSEGHFSRAGGAGFSEGPFSPAGGSIFSGPDDGMGKESMVSTTWADKDERTPPPACGGIKGGESKTTSPHACEGIKGDKSPIENLNPGDWVLSHTGNPRRIHRVIRKRYRGQLIGIQHNQSPITLWVTADHYILCKQRILSYGTDRAWGEVPPKHFQRARELRKEMTSAEKNLWQQLCSRQLGVKFRKQHPIGPYITDFYARDVGLIIEVDGDTHFTPEAEAYDSVRTDYLHQLGLTVLRFTNLEIFQHLDGVLSQIHQVIRAVHPSKTPFQQWRRSDTLRIGDTVYFDVHRKPVEIVNIQYTDVDEEVYDLEVEADHSYLTEVCAVHNCGGGTTAYVAEQWGRRWITIDTSRVAVALARQRLLTSSFNYYELKDESKGIAGGFVNKNVPHITLKSIAQNTALDPIFEKHEPILTEKLETLNSVLAEVTQEIRTKLLAKLAEKETREGKRSITDADKRRWQLPETAWQEWEVPFDTDPDWPEALQNALTDYRETWRAKMDEVNECIAASSEGEELVDQPEVDRKRIRVSGPFTVEAVQPAEESLDLDSPIGGEPIEELDTYEDKEGDEAVNAEAYLDKMIRLLKNDGVRFAENKTMKFATLDPIEGDVLHAEGEWETDDDKQRLVAVVFGPQHGPVTSVLVEDCLPIASRRGYDELVFAGFSFDGASQAIIQEDPNPRVRAHMAYINPDVAMDDMLKETPTSQLFTVFGLPRTELKTTDSGEYIVKMEGVDIYNPVDNTVNSAGADKVAAWFVDSDYNGRDFCITQAFFPDKSAWDKIARDLKGVIDPECFEKFSGTESLSFPAGEHACVAVKVIDPRGNEVMRVHNLGERKY